MSIEPLILYFCITYWTTNKIIVYKKTIENLLVNLTKALYKKVPWGLRRVGLVDISSSSTSELGIVISIASSESEDAFSFLVEGEFDCLIGEECVREFEGPATLLNIIGSTVGVHSGLLFRFLGVPRSTGWARWSKSCKTNGLFGIWIL